MCSRSRCSKLSLAVAINSPIAMPASVCIRVAVAGPPTPLTYPQPPLTLLQSGYIRCLENSLYPTDHLQSGKRIALDSYLRNLSYLPNLLANG